MRLSIFAPFFSRLHYPLFTLTFFSLFSKKRTLAVSRKGILFSLLLRLTFQNRSRYIH